MPNQLFKLKWCHQARIWDTLWSVENCYDFMSVLQSDSQFITLCNSQVFMGFSHCIVFSEDTRLQLNKNLSCANQLLFLCFLCHLCTELLWKPKGIFRQGNSKVSFDPKRVLNIKGTASKWNAPPFLLHILIVPLMPG